jgi:peptide-methionine (S)-S-oxide reductase
MANPDAATRMQQATLAGGCFWCLQPLFQELRGVTHVDCGYAGGHVENPSYEEVCTDTSGHAEAIQVTFDPAVVTYEDLLHVFFTVHDPTTQDRQGGDVGTQYRSAVFYADPEQKATAEKVIRELEQEKVWDDPVVTEVMPFTNFFRAEEYHQDYYRKNPYAGYCMAVIRPKVSKFRKRYAERLKA